MSTVVSHSSSEVKEHLEIEDKISDLADDILLSILSLLAVKDATRTSILSRRWRCLPTNFTSLDFDASEILVELERLHKSLKIEIPKYVNRVNQVVSLNRAPFIKDFRVCFPLNESHKDHIDRWVKFAISKRVTKLELDFNVIEEVYADSTYTLQGYVLNCVGDISFLTSLCLKRVGISDELFELLLSRCHLLERLFVEKSHDLVNLKVTNSSRRLKYLSICDCFGVEKLEIDAVNLVSFEFRCPNDWANVVYNDVSSLVEARFGGDYCTRGLFPTFRKMVSISARLTKLSLVIDVIDEDVVIPCFDNVKHLELKIWAGRHKSLVVLRCFARACPLLHELKLQVTWSIWSEQELVMGSSGSYPDLYLGSGSDYSPEDARQWLETKEDGFNCTLPHLRKLEWVGAFGGDVDVDIALALYIVKNATKLEQFICDPRSPFTVGTPFEFDDMERIETARRHAWQLAMVIPSSVALVIL